MKKKTALVCLARCLGGLELDTLKTARLLSGVLKLVVVVPKNSDLSQFKDEFIKLGHDYEEMNFSYTTSLSLMLQFRKVLKQYNIVNIIFFGSSEIKSLYFSCLGHKVNFIMRHGTTRSYRKDDFIHLWLYKIINVHFTISEHLKKNVLAMVPVAKNSQVVRVYRSVDFPEIITRIKNPTIRILNLARIDPGKGQMETLIAINELRKITTNFKLQFVGSTTKGNYFDELNKFITQHELQEFVEFIGHSNDVSYYLMNSDIFLFPSWGEGLPNVILEGFAHAIPIIAFNNTVFPEFQKLGFHISLAKDKNIESLNQKLLEMVKNLENELELAKKNRELAKKIFNKEQEIKGILEILI